MTITLITASFLCIIAVALAFYTGRMRGKHKVFLGDGGNEEVLRAMRAHANFIENAPLGLIIIGLLENAGAHTMLLMGLGIALVFGRAAHGYAMNQSGGITKGRAIGTLLSILVLLVGAVAGLLMGYNII